MSLCIRRGLWPKSYKHRQKKFIHASTCLKTGTKLRQKPQREKQMRKYIRLDK